MAPASLSSVLSSSTRELNCVVRLLIFSVSVFIEFVIISRLFASYSIMSLFLFAAIVFLVAVMFDFTDAISDVIDVYLSLSNVALSCVFICTTRKSFSFNTGADGVLPPYAGILPSFT